MKIIHFYTCLNILLCLVANINCQNKNCISEEELSDIIFAFDYETFDSALADAENNNCTDVFHSIHVQQLSMILFDSIWNSRMVDFYDFKKGELNECSLGAFSYLTILNKYNNENIDENTAVEVLMSDFEELQKLKKYGFNPNFLGKEGYSLIHHGVGNIYFLQGLNQLGFRFTNKVKEGKNFLDLSFDRIFRGFPINVSGQLQYFELDEEDLAKAIQVSKYIFDIMPNDSLELGRKLNFEETLKAEAIKRDKVDFFSKHIKHVLSSP